MATLKELCQDLDLTQAALSQAAAMTQPESLRLHRRDDHLDLDAAALRRIRRRAVGARGRVWQSLRRAQARADIAFDESKIRCNPKPTSGLPG